MCEGGINAPQMRFSIGQANETLALTQEWLEQLHHLADHAHRAEASKELAQVTVMLGEAREKLELASESLGDSPATDVSVELV
jgi:ssRNA-specific RNase YbeY (16S rRNA maturation enzyme)